MEAKDLDQRMEEKTKENSYFASAASDAMAAREVESAAWAHQRTTFELGLASREEEIDSLQLSHSQLMKDRTRLEESLEEQMHRMAVVTLELDETSHRIKAMQLEIDDGKASNESWAEHSALLENERGSYEQLCEELAVQVESQLNEIEALSRDKADLAGRLRAGDASFEKEKGRTEGLVSRLEGRLDQMEWLEEHHERLKQEHEAMLERLEEAERENSWWASHAAELEKGVESLKGKNDVLVDAIRSKSRRRSMIYE